MGYIRRTANTYPGKACQKFGVNAAVKPPKAKFRAESGTKCGSPCPPNVFVTSSGQSVNQIALAAVQKDACGVAFAHAGDVTHFLQEGRMISQATLCILVVGKVPDQLISALPTHQIRVPAIYI